MGTRSVPIEKVERVRATLHTKGMPTVIVKVRTQSGAMELEFEMDDFVRLHNKGKEALEAVFPDLDVERAKRYQLYMGMQD